MRKSILSFLCVMFFTGLSAQRNLKKAYFLKDGAEITYADYKSLDVSKFSEINTLPGSKEIVEIFGKDARHGVIHLRSAAFVDQQSRLLDSLKREFNSKKSESFLIILNSIAVDCRLLPSDVFAQLDRDTVEIIKLTRSSGTVFDQTYFVHLVTNRKIKF